MDITQLILDDHHEQRRLFAIIEQMGSSEISALTAVWTRLAAFLEVHALAEETFFYPDLLHVGDGAGGKDSAADETEDAIKDHNEIRDAILKVEKFSVGTAEWFAAVADANEANSDHMGEEERQGLTDFRMHASLELRHRLAVDFAQFEADHVNGVPVVNKDPGAYIFEHT